MLGDRAANHSLGTADADSQFLDRIRRFRFSFDRENPPAQAKTRRC